MNHSRRHLLRQCSLATAIIPLLGVVTRAAWATDAAPELGESDPAAKKLNYVTDAKRAPGAPTQSTCASCALYVGAAGSSEGPCQLFPGKQVKAAGWCSSWAAQM